MTDKLCIVKKMAKDIWEDAHPIIKKIKKAIPAIIFSSILTAIVILALIGLINWLTQFFDNGAAAFMAFIVIIPFAMILAGSITYLIDKYKIAIEACK